MKKQLLVGLLLVIATTISAAEPDNPVWQEDVTELPIPSIPARGMAHGVEFTVDKAVVENGILELREGKDFLPDRSVMIFLFLKKRESIDGKTVAVKPQDGFGSPHIHFKYRLEGKDMPETEMFMKGYTLKLEFGKQIKNKIKGKIFLCLPDDARSFLAGTFEAEVK